MDANIDLMSIFLQGYPNGTAAHVALRTVRKFLDDGNADQIDRVIFVVFLEKDRKVYEELMQAYFPLPPNP